MNWKLVGRKKLNEMRRSLRKGEGKVVAQILDGGAWYVVEQIQMVGGIIWVNIKCGSGKWLAHNLKMSDDLPAPSDGSGAMVQPGGSPTFAPSMSPPE